MIVFRLLLFYLSLIPLVFGQSFQDNAICSLIAATNVESLLFTLLWSCTSSGTTSSNPCNILSLWGGISCTGGYISAISLSGAGLTGAIILFN